MVSESLLNKREAMASNSKATLRCKGEATAPGPLRFMRERQDMTRQSHMLRCPRGHAIAASHPVVRGGANTTWAEILPIYRVSSESG